MKKINLSEVVEMKPSVDLKKIEELLVARFDLIIKKQGDQNQSILVVSAEVKELRQEINKVREEIKNLTAAINLSAKVSPPTTTTIPAKVSPTIPADNKLLEQIKAAKDFAALKTIRENHEIFSGVLFPRGNPGMMKPETLKEKLSECRQRMISLLVTSPTEETKIETPTETKIEEKPLVKWARLVNCSEEVLKAVIESVRDFDGELQSQHFSALEKAFEISLIPAVRIWLKDVKASKK